MRFLSYISGACLFLGLTLVLFVGGLVAYETCAGRPLFDYGLLPGADKEPAPAKKGGEKSVGKSDGENAPAEGPGNNADKTPAPAPLEAAIERYSINAGWDLRGDVRVSFAMLVRGVKPRSFPAYLARFPDCAPAGDNPFMLDCQGQGQEWRREQAVEWRAPQAEMALGEVQWLALGACPELPAMKGQLRLFYPGEPLEIAWESARAGNNKTQTRGEMRFTLRNRQLNERRYQFVVEFSLPGAQFPGECFTRSARAFLRPQGKPCPAMTPINVNCRRHNGRLEGSVEFALDAPLPDAEVAFRCFPQMEGETLEFAQPPLPLPPLPGGRRLDAPANDVPPARCQVEGQRLAATALQLTRVCHADGRANDKVRCSCQLTWDLGQRGDLVSCQGEGKARVSGLGAAAEAPVRSEGQRWEREGRRMFFRVEWDAEPGPRPGGAGALRLEGELPPVRVATAWKAAEFAIERGDDGRPVTQREQDGLKLVRANDGPNRWCNYVFEASPEAIPEGDVPLASAGGEVTPSPAPARPATMSVRRNGQKTIVHVNFHCGSQTTQKIAFRWPSAAKEITSRFVLPDVPLPERRAPMRKELF